MQRRSRFAKPISPSAPHVLKARRSSTNDRYVDLKTFGYRLHEKRLVISGMFDAIRRVIGLLRLLLWSWYIAQNCVAVKRGQGFGARLLYILLGILDVRRVCGWSRAPHDGEPRDVRAHGDFHVTIKIASAALLAIQAGNQSPQIVNQAELTSDFLRGFIEFFLRGEILSLRKAVLCQVNRRA